MVKIRANVAQIIFQKILPKLGRIFEIILLSNLDRS